MDFLEMENLVGIANLINQMNIKELLHHHELNTMMKTTNKTIN
jgi:hypothetical protein